jgi:V8-like Glu-specific endopeptidase
MEKDFLMKTILTLSAFLLTTSLFAQDKGIDVIYGDDNRKDVYASKDSVLVELAASTAAMIPNENLKKSGSSYTISAETLRDQGICKQEKFSKQITAANCSGFLVAPNILVTAGHCIKTMDDCNDYKWVFDYKVDYATQGKVRVTKNDVYSCKRIISQTLDNVSKDDYAVIELDRKARDRAPLAFRKSGKIAKDTVVAVIGHPTGLPTKITTGARVRSLAGKFFVANLDTYGGNSGSAVFNTRTSEVEGILVRGENDYVYSPDLGCQVSNRCPNNGCRGEDVTFITNIEALKKL